MKSFCKNHSFRKIGCGTLLILAGFPLFAQKNQDSTVTLKWLEVNLSLNGGVCFKNHNDLSRIIFGTPDVLGTGAYYNTGFGFYMKKKRWFTMLYGQRASFAGEPLKDQNLEIKDGYVSLSIGYEFTPATDFKMVPNIGLGFLESEIVYTRSADTVQNVSGYLTGNADSYRLLLERLYGRVGLLVSYRVDIQNGASLFPLDIGLNLEYAQAISDTKWKRGLEKALDGPDVFDNSFYVGLTMGWWL